jgi:hypothetical protein
MRYCYILILLLEFQSKYTCYFYLKENSVRTVTGINITINRINEPMITIPYMNTYTFI